MGFADWVRDHAGALDDLEPLRRAVGGARVVALGENSHFIREFAEVRHDLVRFLVRECGFTAYATEFGFSEGFEVDAWLGGAGPDDAWDGRPEIPWGVGESLWWLREHNRVTGGRVRFAGIDVPAAGGSALPALDPLVEYVRVADPEVVPLVEVAREIAGRFGAASMALAAPAWARLGVAEQDALSAVLGRLLVRFRAVEPLHVQRVGRAAFDVAVHRLVGAVSVDHTVRAVAELYSGCGLPADMSAREVYLADSVRWHVDRGERVVVAAHNAHVQRVPVSHGGVASVVPMGQHLAAALGGEYFAVGFTSVGGETADTRWDDAAPFGFRVCPARLAAPEPGSLEEAFVGLGPVVVDLRGSPEGPVKFRMHGGYQRVVPRGAFDAVVSVPVSTVADDTGY
ncbi:erythromycin esterase family protein [Umezawaea endophytica]|uniref:Erythromycin esterase family protein n=1 Tax=Umezawaea endophytica TaxID=1654476 RepID=A0A9X2VN06_9PSEU|nr:erythromycin esterase family protein [Umezawaea endophytica]MCS7479605.1 erythromycin esterase family protein [Umezawaea endophytica]